MVLRLRVCIIVVIIGVIAIAIVIIIIIIIIIITCACGTCGLRHGAYQVRMPWGEAHRRSGMGLGPRAPKGAHMITKFILSLFTSIYCC